MKNQLITKITSFALALALLLSINLVSFSAYAQGTGTESDPYLITTPQELQNINKNTSASYKLAANIDLKNMDFIPIGNAESGSFKGTFDGAGFTVSNLNVFAGKYAGLFGCNEGVIKNVSLKNIYVYGNRYIGGVCGQNAEYGTIENCSVLSGSVESGGGLNDICAGGIIGYNSGIIVGPITNYADVNVSADADIYIYVGGIIGYSNSNENISQIRNYGNMSSYNPFYDGYTRQHSYCGGLIGSSASSCKISDSFNSGSVKSDYVSGGIFGYADSVIINNCYNSGNIISESSDNFLYAAGLVGCSVRNIEVYKSFNSGDVCAKGLRRSAAAGLVSSISSCSISNSYNVGSISSFGGDSGYSAFLLPYASGLVCSSDNNCNLDIKNCYNIGLVSEYVYRDNSTDSRDHRYELSSASASIFRGKDNYSTVSINNTYSLSENGYYSSESKYDYYYSGNLLSGDRLKNPEYYNDWDFENIWQCDPDVNSGFPTLRSCNSKLQLNYSYIPVLSGKSVALKAYRDGSLCSDVKYEIISGNADLEANGTVTVKDSNVLVMATDSYGNTAFCQIKYMTQSSSTNSSSLSLTVGKQQTVTVSLDGINDYLISVTSSDPDIVEVNDFIYETVNITANKVGTATINFTTATGYIGSRTVIVDDIASSISIPSSKTIARYSSTRINASTSPSPTSSKITWTSSDDSVAAVDQNGNVTGVSIGQAVITAATDNGYSDTCTVTVNAPVTSMQFERPSVTIYKNDTDKLNLITDPADTTDTISYSSSGSSYVSVSSDGTITSKSSTRTVTITATASSGEKAYCTVTVIDQPVPVTSVTLDVNTKTVQAGEVFKLIETISPSNATNKSVHWRSTDESVATVNQNGTVTAVAEGKAVITVESENGALDYCEVTVSGPNSKNLSKIYIPEIIETSEEYVDIPVIIENNPGINFASLSIMYDSAALEPVSVSNGKVFGSVLGSIDKENSLVKLCFTSEENVTDNGQLAVIKFKVIGESGQDTPVKVCYFPDEIRNSANEAVAFNLSDGAVNIIAHEHTYGAWVYNGDAEYTSSSDYKNGTQTRICSVCGESETIEAANTALLRRRGNSIALESSITLTTYITKDVVDYYDEVYAEFTRNGKTEKVYASDELLTSGSAQYNIFEYSGISPQAMIDDVEITFYGIKDGVKYWGDTYTYSITDYVKTTLAKPDSTDELKTMLVDLMYYGAACQTYQNYKTDQLMTDILTEEQKQYKSNYELELKNIKDASYQTCENRLVRFGTTLRLNDAVEMAIALNMTDVSIEDLTFKVKVGTRELTYTYAENPENFEKGVDGYWYFYFDGVYAHQMNEEVFITAYQGNEQVSYTLRYSIESYAAIVTDAKLKAVTNAMIYYGNSAKAYAG